MIRRQLLLLLTAAATACTTGPLDGPLATGTGPLPGAPASSIFSGSTGVPIPNRYIVGFRRGVASVDVEARRLEVRHRGAVLHTYRSAMRGMALTMSPAEAAAMRTEPTVEFVEQDRTISVSGTQAGAPWNLDRIDQRTLPFNGTYSYGGDGTGVTVYIIDTGINFTHVDFGGRAVAGVDIVTPGGSASDCFGHGTHVAGIVGGSTYGVAKKVKLVAVRVVDCVGNGSNSLALAGVDWVTQNHVSPAVANVSLGGGYSAALNQGIVNSIASGVTYVVAAGNSGGDACSYSPSSAPGAIAVAATRSDDSFTSGSNFGSCVALLAPGVGVTSDYIGSTTATASLSGTSMASPHVAGLAAIYLQSNPVASPAQVRSAIVSAATQNVLTGLPAGTANRLAYGTGTAVPPTNQPPVARFTVSCPTVQCTFDGSTSTDDAGVVSYAWSWGNGRSETHSSPITRNTYATSGTYTVTLTVKDAGGLTNSVSRAVQVPTPAANQPPTASISSPATNTTVTSAQGVTFSGSGADPETGALTGASLAWTSSIDGAIGSGTTFTRSSLSVGTHTITLTAVDAQGATGSASVSLTVTSPVNQPPTASIFTPAASTSIRQGQSVSFSGSGTDPETGSLTGASLRWTSSIDGAIGSGTTLTYSGFSPGTHTITLTATDPQGATGTANVMLTVTTTPVNQPPVASFTVNCTGQAYPHQCALDASSSTDDVGIVSYKWSWGDGRSETKSYPTVKNTWSAAGSYTLTLTVTDGGGLTATRSVLVQVP